VTTSDSFPSKYGEFYNKFAKKLFGEFTCDFFCCDGAKICQKETLVISHTINHFATESFLGHSNVSFLVLWQLSTRGISQIWLYFREEN
jgi:hypothetical protein